MSKSTLRVCGIKKDGLAMGASLVVILANLWLKEYEPALEKEVQETKLTSKEGLPWMSEKGDISDKKG